ncbi:MAG: patatin-like phospholipase family protein [Mariprofundaceae bacterium]
MMGDRGIVLALGGGGARGLSHIGVIEVLAREGIPIRAVTGSSVGAEIGAFLAAGISMDDIISLGSQMDWISTLRLFTPDFADAGISTGKGIHKYLEPYLGGVMIEQLEMAYAATAADLVSGEEVVLDSGDLLQVVRASISYPGLLSPVRHGKRLLVDGSLVNPVPFDVARSLFGGPVLAIDAQPACLLDANVEEFPPEREWQQKLEELLQSAILDKAPQLAAWLKGFRNVRKSREEAFADLGISSVLSRSQIVSGRALTRLREQLCPPDLMLKPAVDDIGLLEFYRGKQAIAAGKEAAESALPDIHGLLE